MAFHGDKIRPAHDGLSLTSFAPVSASFLVSLLVVKVNY
jgi:hypothetical protein